jgi:phenylacetate-CoA ligase
VGNAEKGSGVYDNRMSDPLTRRTDRNRRLAIQQWDRKCLHGYQCERLNQLLAAILPENRLYASKLAGMGTSVSSIDELNSFPYTTKQELNGSAEGAIEDATAAEGRAAENDFARNLTWPVERYIRFHRTSGTQGRPMIVLDTADDWQWWMEAWQYVLDAAELTKADRVVMAFSFGPFIGFWSAFDAVKERGALVAPTGAMSSVARLELIFSIDATVVFCTPSYALHLIEVAEQQQLDLRKSGVRKIIVAGEPGGSMPAVRDRIEAGFDARVIDHSGATEVGPWGFANEQGTGILVNEAQFIAQFQSIETDQPASEGELSELVLTTLGRVGCPVVRYRTGDLVRPSWDHESDCKFVLLEGGVLGRTDDMMIIRGVNVFPTSIEQILRGFPEVDEFRMTAFKESAMDQLKIEVEDRANDPNRIAKELQSRLSLRIEVSAVASGSLPRFEAKGKRFVDRRES